VKTENGSHFPSPSKTTIMKSHLKLSVLTLLASASLATVQAAETNLVQTLNFKLTAWSQGPTVTNGSTVTVQANSQSIVTKDVIDWLGLATTNNFTGGQLLVVNQFNAPISKSKIIVRVKSKTATNVVDVSSFFASVTYAPTVNSYSYNLINSSVTPGNYYGYWGFYLLGSTNYPALPVTLQMSGFGTDRVTSVTGKKNTGTGLVAQFSMNNAAGTGEVQGKPFIVTGNITITGKTVELVP
jgi:hypothetical protein